VTDSVAVFTEVACRPGRPDRCSLTVGVFPGADHRVRIAGSTCFASGYLTTLTQWIQANGDERKGQVPTASTESTAG
jgi:hypothetical protein